MHLVSQKLLGGNAFTKLLGLFHPPKAYSLVFAKGLQLIDYLKRYRCFSAHDIDRIIWRYNSGTMTNTGCCMHKTQE
jgi:hypothetical protein